MFKSPIKVVHIITLLELGGAQGNTIYTVEHLNLDEFEAHLWSGKGGYHDQKVEELFERSGRLKYIKHLVRPINPFHDLLAIFELIKKLKKEKPNVVHTHSSKAGIIGRIAAHWAKVPVIIHTFHGFGFHDQQPLLIRNLFIWLEKWVARWSSKLIFVSQSNWDTAKNLGIGSEKQYTLIRSGIPIEFTRNLGLSTNAAQLRRELRIPDQNKIVVTIGPFKPQKNLMDFIKMAKKVRETMTDVHFLIIGDGMQRDVLENLVIDLDLVGKVHLPGWRKDISQILSISDIFTLTSLWEGLPRSLLEAFVLGIPAVCYETDGIRDILPRGGGIMIQQGEVNKMAEAIKQLLQNTPIWAQKSAEAKGLIGKDYEINFMVHQQENLYRQLTR